MNDILNTASPIKSYGSTSIGTGYISGGEYLPWGADASRYTYGALEVSEGVEILAYEKGMLSAVTQVNNMGSDTGKAEYPLLYYKGYRAYDSNTGEALNCYAGNNFVVAIDIPAGYSGTICVTFQSPWYWHIGEIVSLLAVAALAAIRRNNKKYM
ncbi:MAG: hypothetical protein NC489_18785 [Ruminococcus flavefaciens]|nr:hypothetical protein [Ruminococcus flavefaciens]